MPGARKGWFPENKGREKLVQGYMAIYVRIILTVTYKPISKQDRSSSGGQRQVKGYEAKLGNLSMDGSGWKQFTNRSILMNSGMLRTDYGMDSGGRGAVWGSEGE